MGEALLDVARLRAELFLLLDGDFYKCHFLKALSRGGSTWAARSGELLGEWGVADYTDGHEGAAYPSYVAHVKHALRTICQKLMLH